MSRALVFPGQGSQYNGMGYDLYLNSKLARKKYDLANEILDYDICEISFKDNNILLNNTMYTQPAIFVQQ